MPSHRGSRRPAWGPVGPVSAVAGSAACLYSESGGFTTEGGDATTGAREEPSGREARQPPGHLGRL